MTGVLKNAPEWVRFFFATNGRFDRLSYGSVLPTLEVMMLLQSRCILGRDGLFGVRSAVLGILFTGLTAVLLSGCTDLEECVSDACGVVTRSYPAQPRGTRAGNATVPDVAGSPGVFGQTVAPMRGDAIIPVGGNGATGGDNGLAGSNAAGEGFAPNHHPLREAQAPHPFWAVSRMKANAAARATHLQPRRRVRTPRCLRRPGLCRWALRW